MAEGARMREDSGDQRAANTRRYQQGAHRFRERNGVWYAYLPREGRSPQRLSLCTKDDAEAERAFRELLERGTATKENTNRGRGAGEASLAEICERYLTAPHGWTKQTLRTARNRALAFALWCENRHIIKPGEITASIVDEWLTERRDKTTHRTINRDLRVVRLMLQWANERGLCDPCPSVTERENLREARRKRRAIVPDPYEMREILEMVGAQYEGSLVVARERLSRKGGGRWPRAGAKEALGAIYATGLRVDELRRFSVDDLWGGALHVRPQEGSAAEAEPSKSYRERRIALSPDAEAIVRAFLLLAAKQKSRGTFSESWLVEMLHQATDALGFPRCGLHDLRRGFATEAVRQGIDIIIVSRWLGHADVATTELYLAEYRSDREVVAPIPRGLAPQSLRKEGVSEGEKQATSKSMPDVNQHSEK